jgi:cell division protein YceG involved in septum cleavage
MKELGIIRVKVKIERLINFKNKMFKLKIFWVILILILAIINILGLVFFEQIKDWGQKIFSPQKDYYAVYLHNGQIYLGNISKITDDKLVLKNVFVLEVFAPKENANNRQNGNNFGIQSGEQVVYNLLKWGSNDFLKNDGSLYIPKNSVLFWTKLDNTATVLKQIMAK